MLQDLRFAWRALLHRRAAALTAVLCLALGIGANAALFGVIDALLFRPPAGVVDPQGVVRVRIGEGTGPATLGAGPSMTWPQSVAIGEQLAPVARTAAYAPRTFSLGSGEAAEPIEVVIAGSDYFEVLGVRPHRGRFFMPGEDDVPGAEAVAVLSHASWKRRLDGDPRAIGRTMEINGVAVTIIGVAPPGFVGLDLGEPEAWLGIGAAGHPAWGGPTLFTERSYWLQLVARRHDGVSAERMAHAVAGGDRDPYSTTPMLPIHTLPLRAMFFGDQRGENPVPVWALGITLAVLLLACATVANLLLAQGAAREREMAVRLALGAPRWRIVRQLLMENLIIALAAAAAAVVLAMWSSRLIRLLPVPPIPQLVDVRVAWFAVVTAALTTLLFGLLPALWTAGGSVERVLRRGGSRTRGVSALQDGLMVAQIALSFVLLVSAGLFVTSFRNVLRIDTGFALDELLEVSVSLAGAASAPAESQRLVEQALQRATSVPGVAAASSGSLIPFYMFGRSGFVIPDGRPDDEQPESQLISSVGTDYFHTMGVRLVQGRAFTRGDHAGSEPVAVVTHAMARQLWPGAAAVGACIRLSRRHGDRCVRVVGVTADVKLQELRGDPTPALFLLDTQEPAGTFRRRSVTLFVRVRSGDPVRVAEPVRRGIQSLDAGMPFVQVRPLGDRARPSRIPWEVAASLFSVFGALATLLAAVGLYMVVAFIVAQRRRELGIRSALGSPRSAIFVLILGRAARLSGAGVLAGVVIGAVVTRLLAARLYGVAPTDAAVWLGAAALLMIVSLAASWRPARAATTLDPLTVLRPE